MLISVIFDNLILDVIAMICLRQTVELNWNPLSTIAPSVISELTTKLLVMYVKYVDQLLVLQNENMRYIL